MIKVDEIAAKLRQESYHLFLDDTGKQNCIAKSFRFKRKCQSIGVEARVVICIGLT